MNWLFLRGKMERHKECAWKSLDECTDMWTHLFAGLVYEDDYGQVMYSNGNRTVIYKNNFVETWTKGFKAADLTVSKPDIIVARGGFKEYVPFLKQFPKAKKIYYGANHGCIPKDSIKYDFVMCDSEQQVNKCKKHGIVGKLFFKPAAPIFFPRAVEKKYDIGFSAIWSKDRRKNVAWVHRTVPKGLSVLQMGHACKAPSNVSVKLVFHDRMPRAISKCKVILAPYTSEDSCPRIIPEALACGVPVIALDSCQFWKKKYPVHVIDKHDFWRRVLMAIKHIDIEKQKEVILKKYRENISLKPAAEHLRRIINEKQK